MRAVQTGVRLLLFEKDDLNKEDIMKIYSRFSGYIIIITALCISCASRIGEMKIVEESGSKPGWVKSDQEYYERNNIMHFRGQVNDRDDLQLGKREAKAAAIQNISEKINILVSTEFAAATKGSNVDSEGLNSVVQDGVAWISNKLNIQGISADRVYWQKLQKITRDGVTYIYNIYSLAQIPVGDYNEAKKMALRALREQYLKEGKREAEEIAKRLLEGLYEENK